LAQSVILQPYSLMSWSS